MRRRQILVGAVLTIIVLALAAFSMWIILLRMRPLDPEILRAPGFSNIEIAETTVSA